ncbi:MAG: ribosome biogenesis GTP-binding protein YihA/YsxC [Akkermansiaceae bacterium]|jgi:GTP-binding protein|tara:strand:- start:14249 stop:14845 length:597 start_codon:yes stop_codon:yes gene_type:complete
MQIQSATFESSSPDLETCPESDLAEFAFIGRSNVGKSSLINALTNKKDLAIVSNTPGRTRLINFFLINEKWSLVDLPGYGYAKASGQHRGKFNEFVSDYLNNRPNLSCVFVLIDSRHTPQKIDLEFTSWLVESGIPFVLVYTKTDKVKPATVTNNIDLFKIAMSEFCKGAPRIYTTSSKTGDGRKDILNFIGEAVAMR